MNAKSVFLVLLIANLNLNLINCELVNKKSVIANKEPSSNREFSHRHTVQQKQHRNDDNKKRANQKIKAKLSKSKYTIEDLLTNTFPTRISNDVDLDICKSGKLF